MDSKTLDTKKVWCVAHPQFYYLKDFKTGKRVLTLHGDFCVRKKNAQDIIEAIELYEKTKTKGEIQDETICPSVNTHVPTCNAEGARRGHRPS